MYHVNSRNLQLTLGDTVYNLNALNIRWLQCILEYHFGYTQNLLQASQLNTRSDYINQIIHEYFTNPVTLGDDGIKYWLNNLEYDALIHLLIKYFGYTDKLIQQDQIDTIDDCKQAFVINLQKKFNTQKNVDFNDKRITHGKNFDQKQHSQTHTSQLQGQSCIKITRHSPDINRNGMLTATKNSSMKVMNHRTHYFEHNHSDENPNPNPTVSSSTMSTIRKKNDELNFNVNVVRKSASCRLHFVSNNDVACDDDDDEYRYFDHSSIASTYTINHEHHDHDDKHNLETINESKHPELELQEDIIIRYTNNSSDSLIDLSDTVIEIKCNDDDNYDESMISSSSQLQLQGAENLNHDHIDQNLRYIITSSADEATNSVNVDSDHEACILCWVFTELLAVIFIAIILLFFLSTALALTFAMMMFLWTACRRCCYNDTNIRETLTTFVGSHDQMVTYIS